MKLLVTGGAGFIGSNFIRFWLKKHRDDFIINFDKLTYAANKESLSDVEKKQRDRYFFTKGDICDSNVLKKFTKGVDIIVNFAAESHVDRSINDPSLFIETNVLGTFNLLDAALETGVKRFHHISTDEVFGSISLGSRKKFNENTPYNPTSPYAASKAASDHLVMSFYKTYKLPITITNCSNNYGPFQHPEKFIPRVITNLIENKKVPIYGKGKNFRDWLFVADHCRAIEKVILIGKVGQTYCVGGLNTNIENIEIVKIILKIMRKDETYMEFVTDRPGHDNYAVNWEKIKKKLGWKPLRNLESGLKETIKWYQENTFWWKPLKTEAENFYRHLGKTQKTSKPMM